MHYYPERKPNESWDMYVLHRKKIERDSKPFFKNEKENKMVSSLNKQVGGSHYKDCKIQPVEYISSNNLDFFEGNIVKYITRHRTKDEGKKDIQKVIHYAELILELFYNKKESLTWGHTHGEGNNGTAD
tara:strand:- start:1178 stop:1564 length:387 start_codon:yes stop_codon:yes gene_type:complete